MVVMVANRHFENKMEKQIEKLAHKREQSSGKSYRVMNLGWRNSAWSRVEDKVIYYVKSIVDSWKHSQFLSNS